MFSEDYLIKFLNSQNYDIRLNKNGRWIDQKCTPDVVCAVADCVINFIDGKEDGFEFSASDIRKSDYANEYVIDTFNKPEISNEKSKHEYDKFFAQPLEMLANANILHKSKNKNLNVYSVNDVDILEYIAAKEKFSTNFIVEYCRKVLKDSEIWNSFSKFFKNQTQESYSLLKDKYGTFIIKNTPINGRIEIGRIFTKILNPLAYKFKKLGTSRGRISKNVITYSELMYNKVNFRDSTSSKPKDMTRSDWEKRVQNTKNSSLKYESAKAKRIVRRFNDKYNRGVSEMHDLFSAGGATQMHHIFPQHKYPEISAFYENIIALTPTQHFNKAHPNNRTSEIDLFYQELLLKAKADTIQNSITDKHINTIYSFDNFVKVLNVGFNKDYKEIGNNFATAMSIILDYYI
ncbi:restriction endonuclease [Streptococcaceae bacterium ESL0729]|nr:restriction endonuclease [Streptococcaceae bacterium ESL0729]